VSYNLRGNYSAAQNRALFKVNSALTNGTQDYQFGNSFDIVYDNVNTLSFAGELNIDINRNFKLGIKGEYFNYSTDNETEAWNLPDLTSSVFLDYQISEKWFLGSTLFFVGERSDQSILVDSFNPVNQTVALGSFFDANAHFGYNVTDYISIFGKVNNIANQNYERWINFPVQGIQFLAGATYQFDF
jgi:outer membrane cobalamin receptor